MSNQKVVLITVGHYLALANLRAQLLARKGYTVFGASSNPASITINRGDIL